MDIVRSIAGHEILRRLADGGRSTVWLAAGDVVLKQLRPGDPSALVRECEALERAAGEHVVELVDVAADDEGDVLVLRRVHRGSLVDLLVVREGFDAGEVVTILVPVARALARMHAAGVAHAALDAGDVLFRADGAPVLCGFGSAVLFRAGLAEVELEREPGVVADREGLGRLAVRLLARVTGSRSSAAAALGAELADGAGRDLEERLVRGLFDLAAARPVAFEVPAADAPPTPGAGRVIGVVADAAAPEPSSRPSSIGTGLATIIESGPRRAADGLRRALRGRWAAMPAVRRRVVLASVAGGAAVLVLAAILPGPSSGSAQPGADSGVEPGPAPSASPMVGIEPEPDPLLALDQLLALREQCFRELSVVCLAAVAEPGSSAERADRTALDALLDDGEQPQFLTGIGAELVEQLGGSALIRLAGESDPASVLLMRTEAGWRIRDYLAAGAGVAG